MNCRVCGESLQWIHGHGQCETPGCLLKGQNQAPCCDGGTTTVLELDLVPIDTQKAVTCRTCKGEGQVLLLYPRPGSPPGNQMVLCPDCRG